MMISMVMEVSEFDFRIPSNLTEITTSLQRRLSVSSSKERLAKWNMSVQSKAMENCSM